MRRPWLSRGTREERAHGREYIVSTREAFAFSASTREIAGIDATVQGLIAVAAGGAVGSVARYLVTLGAARTLGTAFPWGTLAVNVAGSFVVALVLEAVLLGSAISPNTRLLVTTGFCGGLTTYSTFNYEVLRLVEEGTPVKAAGYLALTLVGCAAFGLFGLLAARALAR